MENHFGPDLHFNVDSNIDPSAVPLSYFTFEDPFAQARETIGSLNQDVGLECSVKAYEMRYNGIGEMELLQVGKVRNVSREENSSRLAAVVLTRFYDKLDELTHTELHIQSPYIKTALRKAIQKYPELNLNSPTIVLRDIPKCLFHYRKEIADYARSIHDPTVINHINLIQTYAYQQMSEPMLSYMLYMESGGIAPGLDFPNLWMAFRPGDLIFTETGGVPRILRFSSMTKGSSGWFINATYIDSDGKKFGQREDQISIKAYDDYKPLAKLEVYPLDFHEDKQSITRTLYERGLKFTALQGICYRSYTGTAREHGPHDTYEEDEGLDRTIDQTTFLTERIIVDAGGYLRQAASNRVDYEMSYLESIGPCKPQEHIFGEEDLWLCSHEVPAFSLSSRRWWKVNVVDVGVIDFNTEAYDKLILPGNQKEIIHSLVSVHSNKLLDFDDIIVGKGKGMIFLLHGDSGTGKTLTAEAMADYTKRPLYVVGCADLGITIGAVERNLTKILRMSTEWNAILLLDEADVFLERRSTHDLERNGLVSVFLRTLEYFEGILFLTTNRIDAFDKAVRSRVHMALHFPKLTSQSRFKLWETFIVKVAEHSRSEWCDDAFLLLLAERELNGRQIKNAVRTAHALAVSKQQDLGRENLLSSLDMLLQFDIQLEPDYADSPADAPTPIDYGRNRKRPRLY